MSDPSAGDRATGLGPAVARVLEGVATNLVTAAVLWLAVSAAGVVGRRPELIAAAVAVLLVAAGTVVVAWINAERRRIWLLRSIVNWLNLSTPLGVLLGYAAGGRPYSFDAFYRIRQFRGCRRRPISTWRVVTVGNVLLLNGQPDRGVSKGILVHEGRHSTQYACLGGVLAIPLYGFAMLVSLVRTGNRTEANVFENVAGPPDESNGYVSPPAYTASPRFWVTWAITIGVPLAALAWFVVWAW
jgi:hypothetical protein